MDLLGRDISYLPGLGPKRAEILKKEVEIRTYLDLLHYFPYRYVDRSRFYTIADLQGDMPHVQLSGTIRNYREEGTKRSRRLIATFSDGTGTIDLIWFRGYRYIPSQYPAGARYVIFGKPVQFRYEYSINHPEIDSPERAATLARGLVPMYNTTERMKSFGLNSRRMQEIIHKLLQILEGQVAETLPAYLVQRLQLLPYQAAICSIHYPNSVQDLDQARVRLKFEELFYLQLRLLHLKGIRKERFVGIPFAVVGDYFQTFFHHHLPFELTTAQKRVVREIRADCRAGHQMNRLVQGDVGSGKTMVALLSMLLAMDNGCQACMMAPTEILARQHYAGLSSVLAPMGVEVGLLIGSTTKAQRAKLLPQLASGELQIVVGTHALIEEGVVFSRLGLAVIDEQHRFGVEQRARLWIKNVNALPHVLIMSATPIPRTLAMTMYGDLDVSIIDELPPGRKPVQTVQRYDSDMEGIYQFLGSQIRAGRQAYVVFPMIEGSEKEDYKNIEDGYTVYSERFPSLQVEWVHGKMKPKEKDAAMQRFISGKSHILLATTVIEVGVNVPNATVMIIEDAGRFGLSQLHQLRGRVGRGADQSYCILVTSSKIGGDTARRLQVMTETNDGFEIAEEDMRIRGFGEIEGTRQSGQEINLRIANPVKDVAMIATARDIATQILTADPHLKQGENVILSDRLRYLYRTDADYGVIS